MLEGCQRLEQGAGVGPLREDERAQPEEGRQMLEGRCGVGAGS
jgi:hypothetical protein